MISGENSIGMLRMIDNELEKTLPAETVRRVQIPGATHGMWHENPQKCKQALMKFLTDNS
jgi:pimeloyl-ACP methyl ester carboxylesterase